jgi:hypothetical protein
MTAKCWQAFIEAARRYGDAAQAREEAKKLMQETGYGPDKRLKSPPPRSSPDSALTQSDDFRSSATL